ncbi:DUF2254 domain-containing protein [Rhodopila sp.]|uniref:DUF2254 domain-containing protein n=1 Tax=Rhodopila sp. TaxID=2480087 RepID=UPI003D0B5AA1
MLKQLPLRLRSAGYSLRGGFLVRPLLIALLLGLCGAVLSSAEEAVPALGDWLPTTLFPSHQDAQVAQVILSVIATSTMTVVSIVFAILLMTLTLASMQFSPRILISFVRDQGTQWTLGIFLGTFTYCLAALPAARSSPRPFAPMLTVLGAMLLALIAVGWLLFFIHHISHAISVNHIVDRIARETEEVIDTLMPDPRLDPHRTPASVSVPDEPEFPILNEISGYIRFIDTKRLLAFARQHHLRVRVTRRVGHFVPAGVPLLMVSRRTGLDRRHAVDLTGAFDMGPMRTLQQDVEFGVIQIVDIALRAISPAVNDPSTAISCIDQLTRILIRWIDRIPPESQLFSPPHVLRVVLPWIDLDGLLNTAIEQIRAYAVADAAVSLRLLRLLDDLAVTIESEALRRRVIKRATRVVDGCRGRLPADDLVRLEQRQAALERICTGGGTPGR